METYGRPGGSLSRTGRFDPGATSAGVVGEQATAKLIEQIFSTEPDVHVFHDLRIPGPALKGNGNIDHVIVRGHNLVVVDSKRWKPGFLWTVGGHTRRGAAAFPDADKRTVGLAMDRLREYLTLPGAAPSTLSIHGVVLAHPSGTGRLVGWLYRPADHVDFATPVNAKRLLRRLVGAPAVPDARILRGLYGMLEAA